MLTGGGHGQGPARAPKTCWTGTLAVGLIVWIGVQLLLIADTMWLQWFFLATGRLPWA